MKDCGLIRNHLDAYADGELEPSPVIELEAHLHGCDACRDELHVVKAIKRGVHAIERPSAPSALHARVLKSLDEQDRKQRHGSAWFQGGLAVAAAALLAVVVTQRPTAPERAIDTASVWQPSTGMVRDVALRDVNEVVARHTDQLPQDIRAEHPDQVTSYLRGKIGFRVRPVEFAEPNVRLVGARVSNVGQQPAARLDYDVSGNRMTLLVFQPSPELEQLLHDDAALERSGGHRVHAGKHVVTYHSAHGYTVPVLEQDGVAYAFAGDLDAQQLLRVIGTARLP